MIEDSCAAFKFFQAGCGMALFETALRSLGFREHCAILYGVQYPLFLEVESGALFTEIRMPRLRGYVEKRR